MKRLKSIKRPGILVLACAVGVLNAFCLIAVGYFFGKIDADFPAPTVEEGSENAFGKEGARRSFRPSKACPKGQKVCISIVPVPEDQMRRAYVLSFYNASDDTQRVLRPLDGSLYSWHQPYYRFSFVDAQGTKVKPARVSRCGNSGLYAGTSWPEDYVVEILPGKSWETQLSIPFHSIPENAAHMRFEYIYNPLDKEAWNYPIPEGVGRVHWHATDLPLKHSD